MTRIRTSAPIDPNDRFTQQIKALQEQVAELQRVTGRAPWRAYTPTLGGTGWAVGNGTLTGRARITQQLVHFSIRFVLGSTSTAGAGSPTFALPVSANSEWTERLLRASASSSLFDATGSTHEGRVAYISSSVVTPLVANAAGTYAADANVTGTAPFTFAVNDEIAIAGWYRPA